MEIRSSVTPRSLRRLHWMLIPGLIKVVNCADRLLDLGSVATGIGITATGLFERQAASLTTGPG
jgi:hypothetical protein